MEPFKKTGIQSLIDKAKMEYRKEYKKKWKENRRTMDRSISVLFNSAEYSTLSHEAKQHGLKVAPFIRQSVLAYLNKTYLLVDPNKVNEICLLLKMMLLKIEDLIDNDSPLTPTLQAIQNLEHEIRVQLNSPLELHEYIKKHVLKDISNKHDLLTYILSL